MESTTKHTSDFVRTENSNEIHETKAALQNMTNDYNWQKKMNNIFVAIIFILLGVNFVSFQRNQIAHQGTELKNQSHIYDITQNTTSLNELIQLTEQNP